MAATALTVQEAVRTGLEATYTPIPTDGVIFINDGSTLIHVKNTAGTAAVVTIVTPATYSDLALSDQTVSIPAGEDRFIGPFPRKDFNDSAGKVTVTTDTITTTTIAAIKL